VSPSCVLILYFDPPCEDTKQTIKVALGVKVKMVTGPGDQLSIAKEAGCCLGVGDHIYPAKVLKDGPPRQPICLPWR